MKKIDARTLEEALASIEQMRRWRPYEYSGLNYLVHFSDKNGGPLFHFYPTQKGAESAARKHLSTSRKVVEIYALTPQI